MTLTADINDNDTKDGALTPYEKLTYILNNDQRCLKEVTLGKRIGFYRIRGELGSGNFSQVKMAVHSLTREKVAIKILDKTKLDQKTQRLLSREISSMEKLKHPNIIRLYEVVETLAKIHMVMEYASGGELFTKVTTEGRLAEPDAKVVFSQVLGALQHMHERNIIHRDLKAENVLYCGPSTVKVGDFGFSTYSPPQERLTTFCGSPPYAAPELFKDDYYEGRMVDVWALGVMLYFMVTGVTPFRADTVGKLKRCILDGTYAMPPYVSEPCSEIVRGVLRRLPAERLTLEDIRRCGWLAGVDSPPALHQFEHDPATALTSSGDDEREATRALSELGITASVVRSEAEGKDVHSSVTGVYRIVLHRIQKRKYPHLAAETGGGGGRGFGSAPPVVVGGAGHKYGVASTAVARGGGGGADRNGDKRQSKMCVLL